MNMLIAVMTLIMAVTFLAVAILEFRNWRKRRIISAFRKALLEWSESCDWKGYDTIPPTMYFDLVSRIQMVAQEEISWLDWWHIQDMARMQKQEKGET